MAGFGNNITNFPVLWFPQPIERNPVKGSRAKSKYTVQEKKKKGETYMQVRKKKKKIKKRVCVSQ